MVDTYVQESVTCKRDVLVTQDTSDVKVALNIPLGQEAIAH